MAPYLRGTRYVLLSPDEIKWLLLDNFTGTIPAGSVNGTLSDSGHVRTMVDTLSHASIDSGNLKFNGGRPVAGDPLLVYAGSSFARTPGRMGFINNFSFAALNVSAPAGFGTTTANYAGISLQFNGDGSFYACDRTDDLVGIAIPVYPCGEGINYSSCVALRAEGSYYYLRVGAGNWLLLYTTIAQTSTPLYMKVDYYDIAKVIIYLISSLCVPLDVRLSIPLLSTSGAMTWPTTNGLGHAEGVAGGVGAGGIGSTMLDIGTWAADGTYVTNTPVLGPELATGALVVGQWYKITASALNYFYAGSAIDDVFRATATTALDASNKVKLVPVSGLIANCGLVTTDVLAEQIDHAFTLKSQVGWVQSDRSFAAKAAATAAAGQAVISLKEIADQSATGLAITDTITIKHAGGAVTYAIASVAGGANVAYNDTTKTQTVTLGANITEEVAVDGKVGLDWKAWNGSLTYFDGAGNIKLDEVADGVYTNRGSTATAFVADARLIVRKIDSEYRVFFEEAPIGSAIGTVAAGAMVGKYWGWFVTAPTTQITSGCVNDTGNVTDAHAALDRYSRD